MDTIIVNITDTNDVITINVTDIPEQITVNLSECISHIYVDGVTIVGDGSYSNPLQSIGTGDMNASVYDPTNIAADAFDYNNFYNTPYIPTNTSHLINDGADGINPFITLLDLPSLSGYVPYTGATQDVDLGEWELKAGQIELDQSPTGTAGVAVTQWNNTHGITETTLKGGNVVLKNGVDLVARVVNKVTPNITLTKAAYQVVKVSGAQGQRLAVGLAQANNDNNSADTLGIAIETILTNQEGFIMTVGQLEEINTTGSLQGESWNDGDVLYLSPTTAGRITNIKPTGASGHIVVLGYVEYAHAIHGKIYVKIMNGWELDELHNVYINTGTLANNDVLTYESATQLWKNKTIATTLGYTPVPNSRTISTNSPLSGGGDLSADRTLSISQANGSTNGYLSSTDWTTFNGKQNALGFTPEDVANKQSDLTASSTKYPTVNAVNTGLSAKVTANVAISGATKTKITYDSKGLVTSGADATTADITDSTNKRYVTDAQLTIIGNTSGTNTGDETQATIKTKLGAASSLADGYLTSTDWSTFNGKQSALGFTPEDVSNKSTNTSLGTSNTLYPTQNAVKTYVDNATAGGSIDLLQVQVFS